MGLILLGVAFIFIVFFGLISLYVPWSVLIIVLAFDVEGLFEYLFEVEVVAGFFVVDENIQKFQKIFFPNDCMLISFQLTFCSSFEMFQYLLSSLLENSLNITVIEKVAERV